MAHLAKGIVFLCLLALSVSKEVDIDKLFNKAETKIKIADEKLIAVDYDAKVATPIKYKAGDYEGPYDPFDPKGIAAARHRFSKIEGKKKSEVIKSYVPPGIDKLAKKETSKVLMGEGRRFAFTHPKETADLVGIALKAKRLYQNAAEKVKKMESKGHH